MDMRLAGVAVVFRLVGVECFFEQLRSFFPDDKRVSWVKKCSLDVVETHTGSDGRLECREEHLERNGLIVPEEKGGTCERCVKFSQLAQKHTCVSEKARIAAAWKGCGF